VRISIKPDDAAAAIAARPRPVCYVLERESRTDLAVLSMVCATLRLPRLERRLLIGKRRADQAYFELMRPTGLFTTRRAARAPRYLVQLVAAAAAHPEVDVDLVPVAIFWGRAPHKEASLWGLLFVEDWVLVGRFRKVLNVLVNGRNTLVHFGEPVRLRDAMQDGMSEQRSVRWILRNLRSSLRAQRASTVGPDLSHRRTLVAQLPRNAGARMAATRRTARGTQVRGGNRRQLFAILRALHVGDVGLAVEPAV
jgi:glycerol-3-phosphate O-acyltransferase